MARPRSQLSFCSGRCRSHHQRVSGRRCSFSWERPSGARDDLTRSRTLAQALGEAGDDSRTLIAACALLAVAYVESDRAERAVEVLRQAAAAVGHRTATLDVTEGLGSVEPEAFRDARLGVVLEASIAVVGKMDERTAPAAWRLAEGLQGRLMTLPDAPVHLLAILALHGAQSNRGGRG